MIHDPKRSADGDGSACRKVITLFLDSDRTGRTAVSGVEEVAAMTNGNRDNMGIVVHNKSSAFHPLTKSFINLIRRTNDVELAMQSPLEFIARYLDLSLGDGPIFDPNDIERVRTLRDSLVGIDDERRLEIMQANFGQLIADGIRATEN